MQNLMINYYHRYTFLNEIQAFIEQPAEAVIDRYHLTDHHIQIIRALFIIDKITYTILRSFMSEMHPEQVDEFRRLDWICSMLKTVCDWHAVMQCFLKEPNAQQSVQVFYTNLNSVSPRYPTNQSEALDALEELSTTWNRFHAERISITETQWHEVCALIMSTEAVEAISSSLGQKAIERKYDYIEPFFKGIHQITETMMMVATNVVSEIEIALASLTVNSKLTISESETEKVVRIRSHLANIKFWWEIAAQNIMLLSKMDTGSYAEFRQALLGTSGGDSKQLRALKSAMNALHLKLPKALETNNGFIINLSKHPKDILLNQLLTSIREAQAAATDFWMRHFTLTANTIGIIRGSQGLPVEKLLAFATAPIMKSDSLVKAIGEVGNHYAETPEAVLVEANQKSVVLGKAIYKHVKDEVKYLADYDYKKQISQGVLDHFELGPLEPNDISVSPYHKWFDIDVNMPIHFETHSFGPPLFFFNDSIARTSKRLLESQNNYWETYFFERWNQFKLILFRALNIHSETHAATIDVNVSALLERLLSALPKNNEKTIVLTTPNEFIATKRILASWQQSDKIDIQFISIEMNKHNISNDFIDAILRAGKHLKCLIFSQLFSNTQICLTQNELITILDAVAIDVPIIIDAVQGLFNVPCDWGVVLGNRKNVYVLGSGIKHARSTSGLGFMIYPSGDSILEMPTRSGWCAYLTGMEQGITTSAHGKLLYDQAFQWCGGTPGNVFALELFINTWDAILRTGETIASIHHYTQSLIQFFCNQLSDQYQITDIERRSRFHEENSNALTLCSRDKSSASLLLKAKSQKIHFDKRQELLRIGFGMQHGRREVECLLEILKCG